MRASNGSDDNDCSYTAPCRTFVGALAKTNPNGIIGAIEPGDYAPTPYQSLVIDKSVTIVGVPGTVITAASAMDGIVFTSSAEQVTLIGLTLNGQKRRPRYRARQWARRTSCRSPIASSRTSC